MHTCVLAVDPGFVTGVAWHRIQAGPHGDYDEFGCTELARSEFVNWFDFEIGEKGSIDFVVVEQFNVTRATPTSYANHAIEVIGQTKLVCEKYGVDLVEQTRQTGKSLGTTERLKKLGWHRSYNPHAMDAARHLLAYRLAEGWSSQRLDLSSSS